MSDTSSSTSVNNVFRVRNWQQLLGPQKGGSRSGFLGRLAKITLSPCPGMSTLVRKRLFNLPQGVASYSVWLLLVQIAAQTSIPGCLVDEETPLTAEDLSLLTDVPLNEMQVALENLARPGIRLIESVALGTVLQEATAPAPIVPQNSTSTPTEVGPQLNASVSTRPLDLSASKPQGVQPPAMNTSMPHAVGTIASTRPTDLRTTGSDSLAVGGSSDLAKDIEDADQQLARLMGVFDQVQQMKQQVGALSGPLQSHLHTRKNRKRKN